MPPGSCRFCSDQERWRRELGGRCGVEVRRGGPAAAQGGGLNQQVSESAAGEGQPSSPLPPHAARGARAGPGAALRAALGSGSRNRPRRA